jgi:hypothetical protein
MKLLEKEFTYKGFTMTQMYRDGKYAIYKQSREGYKGVTYEAVIIESHNGYELAGQKFPPSEVYPSSTQWGIKGFTLQTYEDALKKINYLKSLPPSTRGRKKKKR